MPMVVIGLIGIGFLPTIDPSMKLLAAETQLAVEEDDRVIAVTRGGKVVLVYNKVSPPVPPQIDPVFQRSGFLHPVFSPRGKVVTDVFPADHPHQHTQNLHHGRCRQIQSITRTESGRLPMR